jgi:hypothetical protein
MIELVSVMPAPQFGDESSLSARIRAGSRFKRFRKLFSCTPPDVFASSQGVCVHQVENHCYRTRLYLIRFCLKSYVFRDD